MATEHKKTRGKWASKTEFLLACVGYAVGLGNIWRFPYLCYESGGGAFLIPYFVMLAFCGIPLLYMEMAVGQMTRLGPVHALAKLCPLLKGTGVAMVMLSFLLSCYYNVIITWALYFLFHSFSSPLQWKECGNTWNDGLCQSNEGNEEINGTDSLRVNVTQGEKMSHESPSFQYFNYHVLEISSGIEDAGSMRWELAGYLFLAWFICFCCLCKGVKSVGKVVYVTAIFPYVMLIILLVRSVTLPGAIDGIYYFLVPDWKKLIDLQVWLYAAVQNFNSIGISFGSLIAFSSYNCKSNNIFKDTLVIAIINSLTSLLAGFVVFSALGGIAATIQVSVTEVVKAGPELVFVVIPSLFTHLPLPNLWAALFFLMLIFLGIDSQFATVEVINTSLLDEFHTKLKNIPRLKEIISLIVCFVCFVLGLPHVTQGGIYLFMLVDHYAAILSLMFVAYFEVMTICWFYGANRLAREIGFLSGHRVPYFFPFCWLFISPLLITVIMYFSLFQYKPPSYGHYLYPVWAQVLGFFITLSSIIWVPIGVVHTLITNKGSFKQRFLQSVTPTFVPTYATNPGCSPSDESNGTIITSQESKSNTSVAYTAPRTVNNGTDTFAEEIRVSLAQDYNVVSTAEAHALLSFAED